MRDSSLDQISWEKEATPLTDNIAKALERDDRFQVICGEYGIDTVDVTSTLDVSGKESELKVQFEGYPILDNKPPTFSIFIPLTDLPNPTRHLNTIKKNIRDALAMFLKYPVNIDDVITKGYETNMMKFRIRDDDEKILYFVECLYTGEKMLRYESHYSQPPPRPDSSETDRSSQLDVWIKTKKQVQKELYAKKIMAYWRNGDTLHLITEHPDQKDEGVWEGAEDDWSVEVKMIVLEQSMLHIIEDAELLQDVGILDCNDSVEDLEKLENDGSPLQLRTNINGRIVDNEEDIKAMVKRLEEGVEKNGQLALQFVPSLEEDENGDQEYESWQGTIPMREVWDIQLYKLGQYE